MESGELEVFSSLLKQSDDTETSNGERASHCHSKRAESHLSFIRLSLKLYVHAHKIQIDTDFMSMVFMFLLCLFNDSFILE